MRNSGCDVPEYMLHLKKPSRDDKKKLIERAPKRDGIRKESKYEKEGRKKKEEMIAASRKRKQEAIGGNLENESLERPKKSTKIESISQICLIFVTPKSSAKANVKLSQTSLDKYWKNSLSSF